MATYNPIVQEHEGDLLVLSESQYQLQVAKSVSSPRGTPQFNVVFASRALAPEMSISWTAQYGLNWTTSVPAQGATVVYSGNWQACSAGQSYDLDSIGEWVVNDNNPYADANSLNIGSNGYSMPVNVVVGVEDPSTGQWQPIFIDPDQLVIKAHGEYEPRESIQLWYQDGTLTSTMIFAQSTPVETFDMTGLNQHYFTYITATGTWEDQSTPFPPGSK